jgi:hypothetical protein
MEMFEAYIPEIYEGVEFINDMRKEYRNKLMDSRTERQYIQKLFDKLPDILKSVKEIKYYYTEDGKIICSIPKSPKASDIGIPYDRIVFSGLGAFFEIDDVQIDKSKLTLREMTTCYSRYGMKDFVTDADLYLLNFGNYKGDFKQGYWYLDVFAVLL